MSRGSRTAAARTAELAPEHEHREHTAHVATPPFEAVEAEFFRRGDAGMFEPPVYLPVDSIVLPLAGALFFVALTVLALH